MTEQRDSAVTAAELDELQARANDALKSPMDLDPNGWTAPTCGLVRKMIDALATLRRERDDAREAVKRSGEAGLRKWKELIGLCAKKDAALREARQAMVDVLCDPEDEPCFHGSDGDRAVIREAMAKIEAALAPAAQGELDALGSGKVDADGKPWPAAQGCFYCGNGPCEHPQTCPAPAPSAGEVCQMCNGHGLIGGFISVDSGWEAEPCPDCNAPAPSAGETVLEPRNMLERAIRCLSEKGLVHHELRALAAAPTTGEPT